MFKKYFDFEDKNNSFVELKVIKNAIAIKKDKSSLSGYEYSIILQHRIPADDKSIYAMVFYYPEESLRDAKYEELKKIIGVKS